jgi:hypothetical protein
LQGGRTFPITTTTLQILDNKGLPAKLHAESVQSPTSYQVREYALTTDDFVNDYQQSSNEAGQWIPDPTAPFELGTLSQEQGKEMGCRFTAVAFLVGMLVLLALGYQYLQR